MAGREEVEQFLSQLKAKLELFGVVFEHRKKNLETLAELDILAIDRENYLKKLSVENFYSGPHLDEFNPSGPEYFEFGLHINQVEIYIKLTLGLPNRRINCISFHRAERLIVYPYKG